MSCPKDNRTNTDADFDVVVVGAGPGGALAAMKAARSGLRVLLAERATWPRYKVCGCCLNLRALSVLKRCQLLGALHQLQGEALREFHIRARHVDARVPLPGGLAVSRSRFDAMLVERAVDAGATFESGTGVSMLPYTGNVRELVLTAGGHSRRVTAHYVVAASGLGGGFLKDESWYRADPSPTSRIGGGTMLPAAPDGYTRGTIYMACAQGGYLGMEIVDGGQLDMAGAYDAAFIKACGGLGAASEAILEEAGQPPIPGLASAHWRGTPALTRRAECVAADRVFCIGDATGYIEPFTGEGMAWALGAAEVLPALLARAVQGASSRPESEWALQHRRIVGQRQWVCKGLAAGLRRPRLVAGAVAAVGWLPMLAAPIVSHLNDSAAMHGM